MVIYEEINFQKFLEIHVNNFPKTSFLFLETVLLNPMFQSGPVHFGIRTVQFSKFQSGSKEFSLKFSSRIFSAKKILLKKIYSKIFWNKILDFSVRFLKNYCNQKEGRMTVFWIKGCLFSGLNSFLRFEWTKFPFESWQKEPYVNLYSFHSLLDLDIGNLPTLSESFFLNLWKLSEPFQLLIEVMI